MYLLRLPQLRRGRRELVELFEPGDVGGSGVSRRFLDGERFQRTADGDRVLELALAEVCHVGGRVGLFRDVPLEFELDQRFADRRLTDAQRVGELPLDEPLARLERAVKNGFANPVGDEMTGGLRVEFFRGNGHVRVCWTRGRIPAQYNVAGLIIVHR